MNYNERRFWMWVNAVKDEETYFLQDNGFYPEKLLMTEKSYKDLVEACYPVLLQTYNENKVESFGGYAVVIDETLDTAWRLM